MKSLTLINLALLASVGTLFAQQPNRIIDTTGTTVVGVKKAIGTTAFPPNYTVAGAAAADPSLVVSTSANDGLPAIIQKTSGTGSGSQASLATSNFGSAVTAGNSIVVIVGVGNNGTVKITDTLSNGWTQQSCALNGTTFQLCLFFATNVIGGTDAVTVTPSASVSLAIAAYEVSGIIGPGGGGATNANSTANQQATVDGGFQTSNGNSTSPTVTAANPTTLVNEIAFGGIAIGTADSTPTAFAPWANDFNLTVGGSPSGLFGLHTYSMPLGFPNTLSLSGTITSDPWVVGFGSFRPTMKASVAYVSNSPTVLQGSTVISGASAWFVKGALGNNSQGNNLNRVGTLPGVFDTTYNNGVNGVSQDDAAVNIGTDGLLWTANLPAIRPASYTAATQTVGTSTTDQSCIGGNATNTVLVMELHVSANETTTATVRLQVIKRSAADTGGTSANMASVPDDSNYAAASTTPVTYTGAGPAAGAAVGDIDDKQLFIPANTSASADYDINWRQKPIVLRGTAQNLCYTFGAALAGASTAATTRWNWIEISTITP